MRLRSLLWLLCLWAASSLAQPKVLFVESSRAGLSDKKADELLGRIEAALTKKGLVLLRATPPCAAQRACLVSAAHREAQDAVVSVALVMSLKSVIVDLEAVSAATSTVLAQANFKVNLTDTSLPETAAAFAGAIGEQLEAEARAARDAKKAAADAPVLVKLEPVEAAVVVPMTPPPSRAPVVLTAVGAGVALVTAAILVGVGASTQAQLPPRDSTREPVSIERAQQLVDGVNSAYSGALVAGGAAGALGFTTLILGLTSK